MKRITNRDRVCLVDGCEGTVIARGWCNPHYRRWKRHGDPLGSAPRVPISERFWRYVTDVGQGCWEWTGARTDVGYGTIAADETYATLYAHRVSYEIHVGPIPDGLMIDHLCRNRCCVNPLHLEPVTARMNQLRGVGPSAKNATKTHCPQGHEYTAENTYVPPRGGRQCRTCIKVRSRRRGVKGHNIRRCPVMLEENE